MNRQSKISLFVVMASIVAFSAARANAIEGLSTVSSADVAEMQTDAARMVPARASLSQLLDINKIQPGEQIKAVLSDKVKLKDGTELARGTVLTGTATGGEADGKSTLTLHFTQAQSKDGKTIPVTVTIVDLVSAGNVGYTPIAAWDPKILQVLQQNVLRGVDLESRIGDANSGTFVAAKKDRLKIAKGSALTLAIGVTQGS
jgi:hypothetical protein